jgi:very-short-patch-repair endonuclease
MRGANVIKTNRARRLRRRSTDAERQLWNQLRSRAIYGFKFVRQEPIGPYIVDFICRERRLIIEVDGGQHATDRRDTVRDRWLSDRHLRVLRFWNNDVLRNMDGVLETIANALQAESPPHPPSLRSVDLSPQAGRGKLAAPSHKIRQP